MIMDHGTRNEERALVKYRRETRNSNVEIYAFGLVEHPEHPWLAGSPDGITSDGVLLEVKCPPRRKIVPGQVPGHYLGQVQVLLEIFDLDHADFIEWKEDEFNVVRIDRDREWFADALPKLKAFWDAVNEYKRLQRKRSPEDDTAVPVSPKRPRS
jgi:hypothetical protein